MAANNDYWAQRTRENAEKAEKQAMSYARRLKSVQKKAVEEIDRYLADLLLDVSKGGTPTRTQLWTAGKYLRLRDCIQQQCSDVGERQKDLLDELLPNLFQDILETNLADFKAADSPFSFLPTRAGKITAHAYGQTQMRWPNGWNRTLWIISCWANREHRLQRQ